MHVLYACNKITFGPFFGPFLNSIELLPRSRSQLVLTPQPPKVDVLLYVRPFTSNSWGAIGVVVLVMLVGLIVPYIVVRNVESTVGHQVSIDGCSIAI